MSSLGLSSCTNKNLSSIPALTPFSCTFVFYSCFLFAIELDYGVRNFRAFFYIFLLLIICLAYTDEAIELAHEVINDTSIGPGMLSYLTKLRSVKIEVAVAVINGNCGCGLCKEGGSEGHCDQLVLHFVVCF